MPLFALMLFCISVSLAGLPAAASAQTPQAVSSDDTARGIKLYRQGDLLGAIEALRTAVKYRKDMGVRSLWWCG
jgi:hypothetical protein